MIQGVEESWVTKIIWAMYRKRDKLLKKQRPSKHSKDIMKYTSIQLGYRGRSGEHTGALLSVWVTCIAKPSQKIQRFWSFMKSLKRNNTNEENTAAFQHRRVSLMRLIL